MNRLNIYQNIHKEQTVVSNCFIDDYMAEANDAQLKIYLFLIRMMSANLPTSVTDIADKFNYTEKDVIKQDNEQQERKVKGNRKNRTNRKGHLLHCKNYSKFRIYRRMDILWMPIL